jgi:hypothetical protein
MRSLLLLQVQPKIKSTQAQRNALEIAFYPESEKQGL